jgi:hypothetical protein
MKRLRLTLLSIICLFSCITKAADPILGGIKPSRTGDLWILSIGINDYGKYKYQNCEVDAVRFSQFFINRFFSTDSLSATETKRVHNYLLCAEKASRQGILDALRNIIDSSKPQDYFVFNFAGISLPIESRGAQIYFLPAGIGNPMDSTEVINEAITLKALGSQFTLIPANNQFFFTEAGPTPEFRREFINVVVEKNAIAAMLSQKKRIVMVPKDIGYDVLHCGGKSLGQGPLNYYLTQLPKQIDVFQLFAERKKADEVVFNIQVNEMQCRTLYSPYTEIFFERDYLEHLQQLSESDQLLKRGGKQTKSSDAAFQEKRPGRKIALIVATNSFNASEQWDNLPNPLNDAQAIGDTLKNLYGYEVEYLFNKNRKDITNRFLSLPKELREDDQLIVYFAGHGDTSSVLDDGYIVCKDSKATEVDPGRETYIGFNGLARAINKYPPKQIMILLDVCFGGSFSDRVAKRALPDAPLNSRESVLSQKLRLQTRKYLSSGSLIEVDDRDKKIRKHSPFAVVVLEALRTKGGEASMLTASQLYGFMQFKLSTSPLLNDFGDVSRGSDYILVANTK